MGAIRGGGSLVEHQFWDDREPALAVPRIFSNLDELVPHKHQQAARLSLAGLASLTIPSPQYFHGTSACRLESLQMNVAHRATW